jgi:UDP-N-acetylmuramoyl-tripeptide--D-alanyl-D-alanine ligase
MESIHVGAVTVLDDTYNANPESMAAALETLQKLTRPKRAARAVAVLGDMLELGSVSEDAHREVGRLARGYGVEVLFTLGDRADAVKQGAIEAGMRQDKILCFRDKALALSALKEVLTEGDVVLVKGSRGVGMEDIVEGLKGFN